jgi:hypothetical protein
MNPLGFGARLVAGFVWLLSTAVWNDNGAWIDTATWQDTI